MFSKMLIFIMLIISCFLGLMEALPQEFAATIAWKYDDKVLAEDKCGIVSLVKEWYLPQPIWQFSCKFDNKDLHHLCTIQSLNGNFLSVNPQKQVVLMDQAYPDVSWWIFDYLDDGYVLVNFHYRKRLGGDWKTHKVALATSLGLTMKWNIIQV